MENENTITMEERRKAFLEFMKQEGHEVSEEEITEDEHCKTFEADGEEWLVVTDEEADKAAREDIGSSLWAFLPSFILDECAIAYDDGDEIEKGLGEMLGKVCENGNAFVRALIDGTCGFEQFCEDAISADGRGHFMSFYDGKEREFVVDGRTWYLYRIN